MIWTHEHIFGSWSLKISNRRKFLFFVSFITSIQSFLIDFDSEFVEVLVWWDFKVQRGWSSHDSAGGVVMGTVAWAEVTTSAHTDIGNWDASEMCADSKADQIKTVVKYNKIKTLIRTDTKFYVIQLYFWFWHRSLSVCWSRRVTGSTASMASICSAIKHVKK